MREAPAWFQAELTRIGGVNPYGEPVFRLVWSPLERVIFGGRWDKDGFTGYRQAPGVPGEPCWTLMAWEPREMQGSPERWEYEYRDEETGLLQCGGYPKYGRYAVLKRLIHREIVRQPKERHWMDGKGKLRREVLQAQELRTWRMEPCGLLLDMIVPLLVKWRRLNADQRREALEEELRLEQEARAKDVRDAWEGSRMSRAMKGSAYVRRRAELIEQGFRAAMAMAARSGLGMQITG